MLELIDLLVQLVTWTPAKSMPAHHISGCHILDVSLLDNDAYDSALKPVEFGLRSDGGAADAKTLQRWW